MKYFLKKIIKLFPVVLILFHIGLLSVTKFTAWPEMLTYPWLIGQGFKYYSEIIQPYLPLLTYFLFIFYKIFGLNLNSLIFITWLIIIFCDVLVFLLASKITNKKIAYLILGIYIILQILMEGNGLWFDLASLPLILISYFFLAIWEKQNSKFMLFISGIMLGLAILVKQNNCIYLLPSFFYIFSTKKFRRTIFNISLTYLFIAFIPLVLIMLIYYFSGQFNSFFEWSFWYPFFIQTKMPGFIIWPNFKQLIILLFIFSPIVFFLKKYSKLLFWFIVSLIFVIPRFGYFHLQHAIAFFCLILANAGNIKNRHIKLFIALYFFGITFLLIKYLSREIFKPIRFFEPNVVRIRNLISQSVLDNQPVYFYNLSSEFFVNSRLIPIKPWADNFPWYMEVKGVQENIINTLEKNKTKIIFYKKFSNEDKFVLGSYKPELLDKYIKNNYQIINQISDSIDILQRNKTY